MWSTISLTGCGVSLSGVKSQLQNASSVLHSLAFFRSKSSTFLSWTLALFSFMPRTSDCIMRCRNPPPLSITAVGSVRFCRRRAVDYSPAGSSLFQILYGLTLKQIGVMLLKKKKGPVLHFCCFLIPPPAIQQSLCERRRARRSFQAMSCTVINVDEWGGRPSLFQPRLNRKFPLSLTMYSLYQSDRVEASHTPLPSLCPYTLPLYRPAPRNRGKPEEAAKITEHKTGKIYMTLSLESHPSTPPGYNYPHATRERKKTKRKKYIYIYPALKGNNSGDDGGEDLSAALFTKESL